MQLFQLTPESQAYNAAQRYVDLGQVPSTLPVHTRAFVFIPEFEKLVPGFQKGHMELLLKLIEEFTKPIHPDLIFDELHSSNYFLYGPDACSADHDGYYMSSCPHCSSSYQWELFAHQMAMDVCMNLLADPQLRTRLASFGSPYNLRHKVRYRGNNEFLLEVF